MTHQEYNKKLERGLAQVRAGQGEQFHAHFAPGDKTLQIPGQGQGRVFAGQIQGDDKLGH